MFRQKVVRFLWQAGLLLLCFAIALIGCIVIGSEIVELIYRHEMGFSLHERLGRDLGLGLFDVMGLVPEGVIGLAVGTWLTTFVFNKIADRYERGGKFPHAVMAEEGSAVPPPPRSG